ncbi:MAG: helix-turn-helix transcriptional regulator [Phycisphaeraceae bacterium]
MAVSALQREFGLRVRRFREAAGLSQEDLAFRARLTRTYVTQIECGKRDPSLSTIGRLAGALTVDLPQLLAIPLSPRGEPR